ncbi:hypothetical protein [Yersinia frederiksenii]|uniref:hypothetical protein n=1 Tax=Yersinia frederiksenii TaxID=29484 RepID=UPI0005DF579D|nr:hypothetical protein [Yersinia frederiksenii]CNF51523.1 Uncharacterised protein [Yersinia frederiksenii]
MSEIKQYDTEVRLEAVMGTNHYGVHIHAMTTEDLHSKSGIAVELAWRDLRIEQLAGENAELKTNARDVAINAANNIAYAIFNLSGKTLDDLKQGVSETTCPTDSALIAERDLRQFAARMSKSLPPRLTEEEMQELAHGTIESFVNACHCKNKDDILLALSFLLSGGLSAGETVKHGEMAVLQ